MKELQKTALDQKQIHIVTNLDLVFVRQLTLSNDILEEIQNYNYQPLMSKECGGYNYFYSFDNGNARIIALDEWDDLGVKQPDYLEKIFHLVEAEWRTLDPAAVIKQRVRTNLNVVEAKNARPSGLHHDIRSTWNQEWSALVHLNQGTDGNTDFFNSMIFQDHVLSVPFVPGQVIIFPSVYTHQGQVPTSNTRYTINYIAEVDTVLNQQVLKQ